MRLTAQEVYDKLVNEDGILQLEGQIKFYLGDVNIIVKQRDVVGNIMQEWLQGWLDKRGIEYAPSENTQMPPDFFLNPDDKTKNLLEVKAFNRNRGPGFDIADFRMYEEEIINKPYMLNVDYLIFGYDMNDDGVVTIKDVWLKKVWEITRRMEDWPINLQIKDNVVHKIRPGIWYAEDTARTDYTVFESLEDFISAIEEAVFQNPKTHNNAGTWKAAFLRSYKQETGIDLSIPRWSEIKDKYDLKSVRKLEKAKSDLAKATDQYEKIKERIQLYHQKLHVEQEKLRTQGELNELIKKEKEQVLNTKELKDLFEKINKAISKNKDTQAFNAYLQQHPDVVAEYRDIDKFKKKVWVKVFDIYQAELHDLLEYYDKAQNDLKQLRDKAKSETTDWNRALDLFKKRFFVPFSIEPANQEDVILNLDLPSFKYIFEDNRGSKEVSKEDLLDVLSTGEKRAYYILNLIFQILVAQKDGREKLVILDDISESFDYKNKHAIIEYISDIAEYTSSQGEKVFKVILLTHNFDFYRTVASRITKRGNSYIAYTDGGKINFEKGQYTRNLFGYYKDEIAKGNKDNIVVASIPFVRNLIEYTEGDSNPEYLKLTSLLHYKPDTTTIELGEIEKIYNQYWCKSSNVNFAKNRETDHIYDIIIKEADAIVPVEKLEIESKLILSMAIRLKSDEYMIQKISSKVTNGTAIINDIYQKRNQSAWLYKEYKKNINDNAMEILEQVAMLTPENIHLNSFMFEPILDMSLLHLYDLYQEVKNLLIKNAVITP